MTDLLLVRHGETDWNREGRFQGHADPPLNALGRDQARELADRLADVAVDVIYSSDLRRAFETAGIIAEKKGLEVFVDPGLREVDVGSWSGLTREQIEDRFPDHERHDGETREQHRERVLATVARIVAAHPGERVLIVSHGGSLRALRHHAHGEDLGRLANCDVYRLAFREGVFRAVD